MVERSGSAETGCRRVDMYDGALPVPVMVKSSKLVNWCCGTDESDVSVAGDVDNSTKKTYGESHTIIKMYSWLHLYAWWL